MLVHKGYFSFFACTLGVVVHCEYCRCLSSGGKGMLNVQPRAVSFTLCHVFRSLTPMLKWMLSEATTIFDILFC